MKELVNNVEKGFKIDFIYIKVSNRWHNHLNPTVKKQK